jgi:hypothetical protein
MADPVPLLPESKPDWGNSLTGKPKWVSSFGTQSASWIPFPDFSGGDNVLEVGYDQGGYGEDGFDSLSINYPTAAKPNWTLEPYK